MHAAAEQAKSTALESGRTQEEPSRGAGEVEKALGGVAGNERGKNNNQLFRDME